MAKNVNFCVWSVVSECAFSKKSLLQKPRRLLGSHLTCVPSGITMPELSPGLPAQEQPEVHSPPCSVLWPQHHMQQKQGGPAAKAVEGGSRHLLLGVFSMILWFYFAILQNWTLIWKNMESLRETAITLQLPCFPAQDTGLDLF